ncbi:MAG: oligosaccharide repeat unit polymerase [Bacteroidetes bacterium]|nr:oligosaccharide repeat unit polymerase [Bacteroidota bacterium]
MPAIFTFNIVDRSIYVRGLAISIYGIIAFSVGYILIKNKVRSTQHRLNIRINRYQLYWLFTISLLFVFFSSFYLSFIIVAAISTTLEIRENNKFRAFLIFILVTILFLFNFTRMYLLIYFLTVFLSFYLDSKKIYPLRLGIFLFVSLLLLIGMREYRSFGYVTPDKMLTYFSHNTEASYLLKSIDTYHTYTIYLFVIRDFPTRYNYYYGSSLIKPLLAFFPRSIWPEKPENLTNTLPRLYYGIDRGENYSSGMTIIGEFYINYGPIGVVVLSTIFGLITGIYSKRIYSTCSDSFNILGLAYLSIFPSLMRGGINTTIIMFIILHITLYVSLLFLKNLNVYIFNFD